MANQTLRPRDEVIRPGEVAPDFELQTQDRGAWRLSDALKAGDVVLCFYPFDFSPVCSTEMQCVTDDMEKWAARGAQVVGVSCDSFFAHRAWADRLGLKQTLLADLHRAVCRAYGLYWPEMNVAWRGTVVVGTDGRVKWSQKREIKQAMVTDEVLAHMV